jgi:hypothetical protein
MPARSSRMAKLRVAIESSPVHRGVLNDAYEGFREFGELPDNDIVAFQVVQRALRGGEEERLEPDDRVRRRRSEAEVAYRRRGKSVFPFSIRELLFAEALFEPKDYRDLARHVIAHEVWLGADVESAGFASRHGTPSFGTAANHVIGFPQRWIRAPFEHQGKELLVRFDNLRARIPPSDPRWFEALAKAIVAFRADGTLPRDDLLLEFTLAQVELDHIVDHPTDEDAPLVMRLFRDVAWLAGDEQVAALRKLQQFAKAGRFQRSTRGQPAGDGDGTPAPEGPPREPPEEPS